MNQYYSSIRPEIIKMIPSGCNTILDVGCGTGALGKYLKDNGVTEISGIEISPEAASEATKVLDSVIEGDIENMVLPLKQNILIVLCALTSWSIL
jgi:tRNA1(Val) A37 N6-methylase TrmN6